MAEICPVLLITLLLHLYWVPSGFSQSDEEKGAENAEEDESFGGTFSLKDYTSWQKKHKIHLFNYAVKVYETVVIWSPILPVPKGLHWSSLNMENELPASSSQKLGLAYSHYFDKFLKTYNKSWARAFTFDRKNQFLRIEQTNLGYADVYRLYVDENKKENERKKTSFIDFDVAITVMTYMNHQCGFKSRPQNPKAGDTLMLSCSVIVNGLWNASLVFRNAYDGSKIQGEVSRCSRQPSVGSAICSTVRVKAETDILAYTCHLEFPPDQRLSPINPMFQNSKWTARFNEEVVCHFPKIYLEVIPSDVVFLCNNMPCGEAVEVNDTISCVSHGYPQPDFVLQIAKDPKAATGWEASEELKQAIEHIEEIEKYLEDGGVVKYSLDYSVRMLLSHMINESIQLVMLAYGEHGAPGKDEEANVTLTPIYQRNFSEMINFILIHIRVCGSKLDGNSSTPAPRNDTSLVEITRNNLKEAIVELEREISAVGGKLLERQRNSPPDVVLDQLEKMDTIVAILLNITEILKNMLKEVPVPEHPFVGDEESEEDHNHLMDEVYEQIAEFKDAYNSDTEPVKLMELYNKLIHSFEFPLLVRGSPVFMDSDVEPDPNGRSSPAETINTEDTVNQSEGTQSMPEPGSLSNTEEITASTEESPAGSIEAANGTVSANADELDDDIYDDIIPANTTDAGNDTTDIIEELDSTVNDTETDEPALTTGLPQLTSEGVAEHHTVTNASDVEPEPQPAEEEVRETEKSGEIDDTEEGENEEEGKDEEEEEPKEKKEEVNEEENVTWEGPTIESDTDPEFEHDEESEMPSERLRSSDRAFKGFEEYKVQAADVGHIDVTCNVSNALGWAYNMMVLEVSPRTEKPVLSTMMPTQPNKDKQTTSQVKPEPGEEPFDPYGEPAEPDGETAEPGEEPFDPVEGDEEVTTEFPFLGTLETEVKPSEVTDNDKVTTTLPFCKDRENGVKGVPESEDTRTESVAADTGSGDRDLEGTPEDATKAGAAAGEFITRQIDDGRPVPQQSEITAAKADPDKSKTQCAAGRHVQTVFLEFFLLIVGPFLAQVEL